MSERLYTHAPAQMCSESFRIKWAVDAHTFTWDFFKCSPMLLLKCVTVCGRKRSTHFDRDRMQLYRFLSNSKQATVKRLSFKTTPSYGSCQGILKYISCINVDMVCLHARRGKGKARGSVLSWTVSCSAQQLPGGIQPCWFWASESTLTETMIQRQLCGLQTVPCSFKAESNFSACVYISIILGYSTHV